MPAPRVNIRAMAQLVQRYLDRIREEHAGVAEGALADYIPELASVDPDGFGLSLSSSDGFVYESGDAKTKFTIQSYVNSLEIEGKVGYLVDPEGVVIRDQSDVH